MTKQEVQVESFDGLFEESQELAGTWPIPPFLFCLFRGHRFIETHYSTRMCQFCHKVECDHKFDRATGTTYEQQISKYFSIKRTVCRCSKCDRNVCVQGMSCCRGNPEAFRVISRVCKRLNKPVPSSSSGHGSGFMCEFPVAVSQILDDRGEEAAERYVESVIGSGNCESARSYC